MYETSTCKKRSRSGARKLDHSSAPRARAMTVETVPSQIVPHLRAPNTSKAVLESVSGRTSDVGVDAPPSLPGEGRELGGRLAGEIVRKSGLLVDVGMAKEEGFGSREELETRSDKTVEASDLGI
jgi:hypothetical protein